MSQYDGALLQVGESLLACVLGGAAEGGADFVQQVGSP